MRKIDYDGSRPFASTLLFSPSGMDSDDGEKDETTLGGELNTMGTLGSESTRQPDRTGFSSA